MKQRSTSPAAASAVARPAWQRYGFALVMLAAALFIRWLIDPFVGGAMPLATMFAGVACTAWFGGWKPAAMIAGLGFFLAAWQFVPSAHLFTPVASLGLPRTLLYSLSCAITIYLLESIRRTERKHTVSEAKVIAILENMRECFCSVDAGWRITAVNRSAEGYLGKTREHLINRLFWEVLPGTVGQSAEAELRRALRDATAVQFETNTFAAGAWHAVTVIPAPVGLSIFCQDITATKAHVDQLEHLVADRTIALQRLVSELEAFSYTLVHDIRAPLRSISGFASILAIDHARQLDAEGKSYVARIQKSAERMDQLIVDILDYSQLSRRKPELRPIDLDETIRELMRSNPEFQPERADIAIDGALPKVTANDALLAQCFSNLLHNAIKFVAPGVKPRVRISAQITAGVARVNVADNGIGIAADATARIFEPFRREHPNYDGTGIGLAIVRKVVDQLDGRVGVDSQVGHGSRFWVELPTAGPVPLAAARTVTHEVA